MISEIIMEISSENITRILFFRLVKYYNLPGSMVD